MNNIKSITDINFIMRPSRLIEVFIMIALTAFHLKCKQHLHVELLFEYEYEMPCLESNNEKLISVNINIWKGKCKGKCCLQNWYGHFQRSVGFK